MEIYWNSLLIGLLSGLLINYFSDSLPIRRRPTLPLCNHCGKRLPLLAYLTFSQCHHCGQRRRIRWALVYLFSILVVYWIQIYPVRMDFWSSLLVYLLFGVISVIDIEYRAVLFEVVMLSGGVFLVIGISRHGIVSTVFGGGMGFLLMLSLYWFGKLLLKFKNQTSSLEEEALGFGDVNLLAVLGLLLGWPAILLALWIAIISAGMVSLMVMVVLLLSKQYRSNIAIPYAPFLVFGAFTLLYLTKAG